MKTRFIAVFVLSMCWCLAAAAQEKVALTARPANWPSPTVADYSYGTDSERQKFDFWQAESGEPTPVVLMIHGGGWIGGDKSGYKYDAIRKFLDEGISVAVLNYRYITQAMEQGVEPPVKACVHDAARAVQTIRSKAKEWNVDSTRVGSTGKSAGGCTSLWLALHDDIADPNSSDPVARESSRLICAAVEGAQTSLDPKELREWMPNAIYGGHAFGFAAKGRSPKEELELLIANREKVLPWIKEYSPLELVSRDDPPVFLSYSKEPKTPVLGEPQLSPTHSAIYGIKLVEQLKEAGVEAVVSYPAQEDAKYGSIDAFLIEKLQAK